MLLLAGKPLFGTLIALLHEGTPILGIIDQPISKERWLGVLGRPTTLNGNSTFGLRSRIVNGIMTHPMWSWSRGHLGIMVLYSGQKGGFTIAKVKCDR